MSRHSDTAHRLYRAVKVKGGLIDRKTMSEWRRGVKAPQTPASFKVLALLEARWRLEPGYFRSRLSQARATSGVTPLEVRPSEARRLAWHLPDDFRGRPAAEKAQILDWVRTRVLTGGTAYSRYHSEVSKHHFALRFDTPVLTDRPDAQATAGDAINRLALERIRKVPALNTHQTLLSSSEKLAWVSTKTREDQDIIQHRA